MREVYGKHRLGSSFAVSGRLGNEEADADPGVDPCRAPRGEPSVEQLRAFRPQSPHAPQLMHPA